jgi:hypothetical protein
LETEKKKQQTLSKKSSMHKSQQEHAKQTKIKFSITTQQKQKYKAKHNSKNEEKAP